MSSKEYLIHINSIRIDNKNNINTLRLTTTKRILNIDLHFRCLRTKAEYQTCVYDKSIKDICKELNISYGSRPAIVINSEIKQIIPEIRLKGKV